MAKDPFGGMFDDLFGDFFGGKRPSKHAVPSLYNENALKGYRTTSDTYGLKLVVDLPGVDPSTVSLEVGGNQVVVTGKNGDKTFTNRYTLSDEFDVMTAIAKLSRGQLEVRMARSGKAPMQKVAIEIR